MQRVCKRAYSHESNAAFANAFYASDNRNCAVGCDKFRFRSMPPPKNYLRKTTDGWDFCCSSDAFDWLGDMSSAERTDVGELREPRMYLPYTGQDSWRSNVAAVGRTASTDEIYILTRLPSAAGARDRMKVFSGASSAEDSSSLYVHGDDDGGDAAPEDMMVTRPISFKVGANGMLNISFAVVFMDRENDDYVSVDEADGAMGSQRVSRTLELSLNAPTAAYLLDEGDPDTRKSDMFTSYAGGVLRRIEKAEKYIDENVPAAKHAVLNQEFETWRSAIDRFKFEHVAERRGWMQDRAITDNLAAKRVWGEYQSLLHSQFHQGAAMFMDVQRRCAKIALQYPSSEIMEQLGSPSRPRPSPTKKARVKQARARARKEELSTCKLAPAHERSRKKSKKHLPSGSTLKTAETLAALASESRQWREEDDDHGRSYWRNIFTSREMRCKPRCVKTTEREALRVAAAAERA